MRESPLIIGGDAKMEVDGVEEVDISRNVAKSLPRPPSAPKLLDLSTTNPENPRSCKSLESVESLEDEEDVDDMLKPIPRPPSAPTILAFSTPSPDDSVNTASPEESELSSERLTLEQMSTKDEDDVAKVKTDAPGREVTGAETLTALAPIVSPENDKDQKDECAKAVFLDKDVGKIVEKSNLSIDDPISAALEYRKLFAISKEKEKVEDTLQQDKDVTLEIYADEEMERKAVSGDTVKSSISNNALSSINQIDPIAEGSYGFIADCQYLLEVREPKHCWGPPKSAVPTKSEESIIRHGMQPVAPELSPGQEQDKRPSSASGFLNSATDPRVTTPATPVEVDLSEAMKLICPKVDVSNSTDSEQVSRSNNKSKKAAKSVDSGKQTSGNETSKSHGTISDQTQVEDSVRDKPPPYSIVAQNITTTKAVCDTIGKQMQLIFGVPLPVPPPPKPLPRRRDPPRQKKSPPKIPIPLPRPKGKEGSRPRKHVHQGSNGSCRQEVPKKPPAPARANRPRRSRAGLL